MKWFSNLSMAWKLGIGFGVCLVLGLLVGLTSLTRIDQLRQSIELLYLGQQATDQTGSIQQAMLRYSRAEKNFLLADSSEERNKHRTNMVQYEADLTASLDKLEKVAFSDKAKAVVKAEKEAWAEFETISAKTLELAEAGKVREAQDLARTQGRPLLDKAEKTIDDFQTWKVGESKKDADRAGVVSASSKAIVAMLLAVSTIIGIAFAVLIVRTIKRSLVELSDRMTSMQTHCLTGLTAGMQALEQGDLTVKAEPHTLPIDNVSKDELGRMAATFNQLLGKTQDSILAYESTRAGLTTMIRNLRENADLVAQTSEQLASSAEETNQAAVSIAETIQQVSNGAEESSSGSMRIAQGTEQLATSAADLGSAMERLGVVITGVRTGSEAQSFAIDETIKNIETGRHREDGGEHGSDQAPGRPLGKGRPRTR
jgi:methyl-accepting chemotaxis protein